MKQRLCTQLVAYKVHQSAVFGDDRFSETLFKAKTTRWS